MISVLIPGQDEFSRYESECRNLYESVQSEIGDSNTFEFIKNNTFFYMFVSANKLIGGIYFFVDDEGKLFLNGFAHRKMHLLNIECLKMSLKWFNCDVYAQARNKKSALCLLRCGFRRIKNEEFVYKS